MNIFLVVARLGKKPSPLLFQQMPGKGRGTYVGSFLNHALVVNCRFFYIVYVFFCISLSVLYRRDQKMFL